MPNSQSESPSSCGLILVCHLGFLVVFLKSIYPKKYIQVQHNPNLNPSSIFFFIEITKLILNFLWKGKGTRENSQNNFEKVQVGRLTQSDFKTYHKAIVIKALWYW